MGWVPWQGADSGWHGNGTWEFIGRGESWGSPEGGEVYKPSGLFARV